MGFNTTVVILNDALSEIREDAEFGRKLADAIQNMRPNSAPINVSANGLRIGHCNAAQVIETHHADHDVTVIVGANTGRVRKIRYE